MIPVYINNWNILGWVQDMARFLEDVPDVEIIIIDNASTYEPLLDWYRTCNYEVIRLPKNIGTHNGYFHVLKGDAHKRLWGSDYFVYTDADLDISGCPKDLIEILKYGLQKYPQFTKAGLSIECEDIPEDSITPNGPRAESGYWQKPLDDLFFDAFVDTTFALYRKDAVGFKFDAMRSNRPYTAKHIPWYITRSLKELGPEQYYMFSQKPEVDQTSGQWTNAIYRHLLSRRTML